MRAGREVRNGRVISGPQLLGRLLSFDPATVLVQAKGYGRRRVDWAGEQTKLTVELKPEAVVSGEALDTTGAPLAGVQVELYTDEADIFRAQVEPTTGRFTLAELPTGAYSLFVRSAAQRLHAERIVLKPGENVVKVPRLSKDTRPPARRPPGGLERKEEASK
jgi:hypothetical protein